MKTQRDWYITVGLFALGIILIFSIYLWLNGTLKELEPRAKEAVANSTLPVLDLRALEAYTTAQATRAAKLESLLQTPERIADPSL